MSFSTLVATSAAEFNFWPGISERPIIQGLIIYLLIPLILVFINAVRIEVHLLSHFWLLQIRNERLLIGIKIYGWLEVVTGSIKILFLAVIVVALIAINLGGEHRYPSDLVTFTYLLASSRII